MKYTADRPLADPDKAARKLVEIANATEPDRDGRIAIELINPEETEIIAKDRAARRAWLEVRGYKVIGMPVADVEGDLAAELDRLEAGLPERP